VCQVGHLPELYEDAGSERKKERKKERKEIKKGTDVLLLQEKEY
jgi:hypothetical protein